MRWWWWWWSLLGVMVVVEAHGELSPRNSEIVQELHDPHDSRGSLQGRNDPSFPPRPRQGSVLDSLIELNLQDEDKDEDEATGYTGPPSSIEMGEDILMEVRPALHAILTDLHEGYDALALPDSTPTPTSTRTSHRPPLMNYLHDLRRDMWSHFRDMTSGYLNLLEAEYETQALEERLPLGLIRSVLQAGDQANLLKTFAEKLNPELLGFLKEGIEPLLHPLMETGRATDGITSMLEGVVMRAARMTFHHFIKHVLWVTRNEVTKEELLQYRDDLRLKVPLAAEGLDLLLVNLTSEEQARSHGAYNRVGISYGEYGSPDGYGGHGGYGGSSQGFGVYLDPYLVLASIGAAALLAFIGYKVILAKSDRPRRRRRDDQLDDTDLPTSLDDATLRYDVGSLLGMTEELDDLAEALNSLWRERRDDLSCMSCWMTRYAANHHHDPARPALAPLLVSLAAHMLGAPRSGQVMDEVTRQVLEGRSVTCPRLSHNCDLE